MVEKLGVLVGKTILISKNEKYKINEIVAEVGFPCFVKPNKGGYSIGISKVYDTSEIEIAINKAFEQDNEVIIQKYIVITSKIFERSQFQLQEKPAESLLRWEYLSELKEKGRKKNPR